MFCLIVQTGEPLHVDLGHPRPMRAMNLTNYLLDAGHEVLLISSDFNHQAKVHRFKETKTIEVSEKFKTVLLSSPGYQQHIGLARLLDHFILGWRLHKYLQCCERKPDVVFVGYPPIEVGYVATRWAKKLSIPSMLDLKDLWPDLFVDSLPQRLKALGRILFSPYFYLRDKTLEEATCFSSMSQEYLAWMGKVAKRPLTRLDAVHALAPPNPSSVDNADIEKAKLWWESEWEIDFTSRARFCFIGTFMSVFDFTIFKELAETFVSRGVEVEFIFCGAGAYEGEVRKMFYGLDNVKFVVWVDYPQVLALTARCSGAIVPYKDLENFVINTPNKVVDALSLGLPILTTLSGVVSNLCKEHGVGVSSADMSFNDFYEEISGLLTLDEVEFEERAKRSRSLFQSRFSPDASYGSLVKNLEQLVNLNALVDKDKWVEEARYDERAKNATVKSSPELPLYLNHPYEHYRAMIEKNIKPTAHVLEIGSGAGDMTNVLFGNRRQIVATDISSESLTKLSSKYEDFGENITTRVMDMEALDLDSDTFDAVVLAGSLSYGDNDVVLGGIIRVLKPGGCFICVDSLNNSPIYKFNRYLHVLMGRRTKSTARRMWSTETIAKAEQVFGSKAETVFFGGISWLMPALRIFFSESRCAEISKNWDSFFSVKNSAFKFVLKLEKGSNKYE